MNLRKVTATLCAAFLTLSACSTEQTHTQPQTETQHQKQRQSGDRPQYSGDRYSLFARYPAYTSITPEEKERIDAYLQQCPTEKGAHVYYDPLYRAFYEDFSTLTPENVDSCRIPHEVSPFINPLALPPIIPPRLVSIYDKLPPVMAAAPDQAVVEEAKRTIEKNTNCSVNRIAAVTAMRSALRIELVARPMWRYLDKDPLLFLSEQDRTSVTQALEAGVPVTVTLTESCD